MSEIVEFELGEQIAWLTLNRPKSLNALNREMAEGLNRVLRQLQGETDLRCLVIGGAGEHFMAGGDIRYFQSCLQQPRVELEGEIAAVIDLVNDSVVRLRSLPFPVIASIRGNVAGFGVSLVAACDLAIASENARFTQAYAQIATTPDGGNTWLLPRQIGLKRSMALSLLNEMLDAAAAERIGLINRVVADEALDEETRAWARKLRRMAPGALAGVKRLLNASLENSLSQQLALERHSFVACALGEDFREGIDAFVEKRAPDYK
ncbi:MAG: enoyl-CoA hydratase/isomerase family protein [Gammaproteobacteria bacterium]|nr:enoyl-CoA hydratase/isomerase family protein [Gammaproteobacteria bacterium]